MASLGWKGLISAQYCSGHLSVMHKSVN